MAAPLASAPNVVVICTDQHRADTLGAYGSRLCRTPHLDRFAAQGVVLERCFSQNPVCMPSRATIATGLRSGRHGVLRNAAGLPRAFPTLGDALGKAGWRTAAVGKLHHTPQEEGPHPAPYYGFQELDMVEDNRIGPYLDWALANFPEHEGYLLGTLFNLPQDDAYWRGKRDLRREWESARRKHVAPLEISPTCNWGYGHFSPLPEEAHHNTWITDRALDRLRDGGKRPLFLWASYVEPHNPFDPPRRFREMYRPGDMPPPAGLEADESLLPACTRGMRGFYRPFTGRDHQTLRALYYGSVTFLDEQIGRLLAGIERTLDMANTVVVFVSDHGELLGDHGIYGKNCYHYDPCVRVPCIARWDGRWGRGARSGATMELTDLFPTLLDAAGVRAPSPVDGVSLAPALAGKDAQGPRGHAFIESYGGGPCDPTPEALTHAKTIRTARWRATFFPEGSIGELYDLEEDPSELRNLWNDPARRGVLGEHREILRAELARAGGDAAR
jgi:arylsulfatase A-like enzyme